MKFSFAIIASVIAAASALTIAATTASTMEIIMSDLTKIAKQFTDINDLVQKFPQNGVKGAEDIHNHGATLHTLFEEVISSINILPKPVSDTNAKKIIDAYTSVTPTDINSSKTFAAKQADFIALSASAATTAKNDLVLSDASCRLFSQALESITPPAMASSVAATFSAVDAARGSAIAAFSQVN